MLNQSKEVKDLKKLGVRIVKNTMKIVKDKEGNEVNQDEKDIIDICNKTFGTLQAPKNPTTNNLELFNEFLVQTVEEIVQPSVQEILSLLSDYRNVPAGTVVMLDYPKNITVKPKFMYTAKGTGVDLIRLSGSDSKKIALPESLTYGGYYEMTTFRGDPVKAFQDAVNKLATAKIELYFDLIFKAFQKAVSNGEIPSSNCASGTNLSLSDFQKVEQTMIRFTGGRPLFVADIAMINHFANQYTTVQKDLISNEYKDVIREELVPSLISKTVAVPFVNTFIDMMNSKVRFSPSQGFILPGGTTGKKPFQITEFSATRQYSNIDQVLEQVELKIVFETNVTLLNARFMGSILDDSITI